ncbi:MAG: YdeI/OmpD-associated family protein [Gemmatimonadaceae bacterium]
MAKTDPRIDAYIAKSADFARPILVYLRELVHEGCPNVDETIKWGVPHFDYEGILCGMAAFKQHCAFNLWKGSLIVGDAPRDAMGHFGRITQVSDLPARKVMVSYIKQAAKLNEAGVKSPTRSKPKKKPELEIPIELARALRKNKKAAAAFDSFPPSHKREYAEWISEAKREETRQRRVDTAIAWMTEGKSRNWQYEKR